MIEDAIQTNFVGGEVSPSLFARTDLGKWHNGASTMRNIFANYKGGGSSRAGLAYVGTCKQPGTSAPPRDIPFQFSLTQGYALEFGDNYMRVKSNGAYVTESAKNITAISQASPAVMTVTSHGYSAGDWIFITGVTGMTNFNGLTWIVNTVVDTNNFTLKDLFGNVISSISFNAYISGGTAARLYTLATPYAAADLPYLKYTQSADTMSLTCVNTPTLTEYPPYDLKRLGATNWTLTLVSFTVGISAPASIGVTAQSSTTVDTWYSYVVTAVSATTGEESEASPVGSVENNNISVNAGSNTVLWTGVAGAGSYNVYKATPSYSVGVPIGASFGYIGTAFGVTFSDSNIVADFTQVPPTHNNPFARGTISSVTLTAQGSGYSQSSVGYTITTSTGSGFVATPIVSSGGGIVGVYVTNGGQGYASTDTIALTGTGGSGATATLVVGPQTGTYPGVVAYYQQRRVYANTLNQPNTYFMSQPGNYLNFDASIPVTDSDSIQGTPWAQQVNGIQFMTPMPGGLITFTGNGAWTVNGGTSSAITPSNQEATPQAYVGCTAVVPPIPINYDILYVRSKNNVVGDLEYNYFAQIYIGTDKTVLSGHLFLGHQILQWCYCEEPYKLIWAVREDGVLLCLTYLKEQDVYAWTRHDTDGLFVGVCSVIEPPVDALYAIVKRYVRGQWVYYSERMNNRIWANVEQAFCVDAGLVYPMSYPNATLYPAAANGTANITSTVITTGGSGYTSPVAAALDPTGEGSGATFSVTLSGGVITAIVPTASGQNYSLQTKIVVTDATGAGAIVQPIITNIVTFTASASVFNSGMVGDVIRVGGGKATITSYASGTSVNANITQAITQTIPDNPSSMPVPAVSGNWSISVPTTQVSGLNHLEGLTVSVLADGSVTPQQTVTNGSITLPAAYSSITVGLQYIAQLQNLFLDAPQQGGTMQGRRKNVSAVTVRMEASRGMQVGTNQPDASTEPNGATYPWTNMKEFKERNAQTHPGSAIPLFTGDERIIVDSDWNERGQIAVQQTYPLPCNVLAYMIEYAPGDT